MDGDGGQDWCARYLAQLATQRQLSPHSVAAYRRDLAELASLLGHSAWPDVAHADIRRLTSKLHAQSLSPRSIARKLSSWRGFFNWLARHTSLAANPVDGVRAPKRAKSLPKALSVDDAVHLVSAAPHAHANPEPADLCNRAMFELLYSSGLRVSELAAIDLAYVKAEAEAGRAASLGWIDLAEREVTVTGKGGKMRKVPVGSHALAALQAWLAVRPAGGAGGAALFLSARGARMSVRVIQLRLKLHAQRVGTAVNVHPHVLRHSFASHVLQSSGDLRAVQDMLGHASITSTQVYTALDFQHLSAVYDQAHPRAKSK
jgi:integrase/recombinase XerC